MGYSHIEVLPVSGALGAEIQGVNLARPLSDDTFEELHRALLDYLVVFFRGQDMTPRQQIALGKRFGELDIHPQCGRDARLPGDHPRHPGTGGHGLQLRR